MNTSNGKVSRKGKVKVAYHEQGQEVAWTLGHKLKLKPSTLRTWISTWRREAAAQATPKAKVAKPKVTTPKAKKPAPKVEPMSKPVNGQSNKETVAAS